MAAEHLGSSSSPTTALKRVTRPPSMAIRPLITTSAKHCAHLHTNITTDLIRPNQLWTHLHLCASLLQHIFRVPSLSPSRHPDLIRHCNLLRACVSTVRGGPEKGARSAVVPGCCATVQAEMLHNLAAPDHLPTDAGSPPPPE